MGSLLLSLTPSRFVLTAGLLLSLPVPPARTAGQARPGELQEWRLLLHAHAGIDHGLDQLVNLQRAAAARDIDAVVITEQLLAQWQWAPPVVRWFWNYRRRIPSIRSYGIGKYLRTVAELDRAVPEVTLIAGTEIAPYYRWTGAPWNRDLSMWDWQRNILALGLPGPDDYARLPVLGLRHDLIGSWRDLPWLAVLLISGAFFLVFLNRLRFVPAVLCFIPTALLIWSGPPPPAPFPAYRDETPIAPYQALIDTVRARGGFTIWTQIEATDDHSYPWGRIHTEPHPQVMLESTRYTAFGAIYPATSTVEKPGGVWDRVLLEYLAGERSDPVWGWGELALHYPEQLEGSNAKRVDGVLSVVLAPDRSQEALLDALREGRGYALLAARPGGHLRLDRFEVTAGGRPGGMGSTVTAEGPLRVDAGVSFTGPEPPAVRVRLVRSGEVVLDRAGVPPLNLVFTESGPVGNEEAAFFRILVDAGVHRLVSNPVFVRYPGTGEGGGPRP